MNRGVVYYNIGEKCMIRILVSLSSLREVYSGDVTLLAEGAQPEWFLRAFRVLGGKVHRMKVSDEVPALVRKARLHEHSPYDVTMFLDADTLVLKPIDEYFAKIEKHKFCTGEFAGWVTSGRKIGGRIRGFAGVCSKKTVRDALAYGKATNTGVFGFTKDAPILAEWRQVTTDGWKNHRSRIPDEVGCQMLLPKYEHWLAPVKWGVSVKHGEMPPEDEMIIVHYHGRKHADDYDLCRMWKRAFWKFYHSCGDDEVREHLLLTHGDRKLRRYLRGVGSDLTVVTAVDPKYLPKLKTNYPLWLMTEGLMEYPWKCFVHGIPLDSPKLDFMRDRVELIEWDLPGAESQRERMLTAFVQGCAERVTTKWCLKLDCDTTPTKEKPLLSGTRMRGGYELSFDKSAWRADVTGHRWGYTKPGEFLLRLEDWADAHPAFAGTERIFPDSEREALRTRKRYGHPRFASFICLQRVDFLREIAEYAGDRLPVPSHDTYVWYCAERLGRKWRRENIKNGKGFKP